ncbi:MAG: anhydro-N-acetylmuramic acid kinase [Crocinitomicaceae bacterium]|nr:anhydro-N-acetylmuramic acid kinase [Crocinitomicaceae bacterium]
MSGTSLDGVDIVHVSFNKDANWKYKIHNYSCVKYSKKWLNILNKSQELSANEILIKHKEYGDYLGILITKFIEHKKIDLLKIDAIASHGHTIFHQPDKKLTFQLGCGASIASKTNIKVVNDFRTLDIAFGGQGAPLVPVGDELLFKEYDYCLNLGGIANISFNNQSERIAGDIGFANMISNYLMQKKGANYDENGKLAQSGKLNMKLFNEIESLPFFSKKFPKSIAKEDFNNWYYPIIDQFKIKTEDKLHTAGYHLCYSINKIVKNNKKTLITGGGAYNSFWINTLKNTFNIDVKLPNDVLIDYKEALIFAFLGLLRILEIENTYSSVTGASKNLKSGIIHYP